MSDLIKRSDAIKAFCMDCRNQDKPCEHEATCKTMKILRNKKKLSSADRPDDPHDITYINALKNRIRELEAKRPLDEGWKELAMIESDIRTETLLKLADHMQSINKTMTELNKEVEEMMQDIMRGLREEMEGADDEM